MHYDPIKDRLGAFFSKKPLLQRLFYALLNLFFLRTWHVHREIRQLFRKHPAGQPLHVLDAGTGFGQYAWFMAQRFPNTHVHAVDVKPDYLENARRFFDQTAVADRVTLALDDLTKLEAEGPYDFILSVDVMEHIEDDRGVFRNFANVLKPGGHVLINTPSDLGGSDVSEEGDTSFIEEHVRDGYNVNELAEKLRTAGLKPVHTHYAYGPYGSLAWRMLIRYPIVWLGKSMAFLIVLPFYYLPVLPVCMVLHLIDVNRRNKTGTGLVMIAQKPTA